jgi:hypothetical protein
VRDSRVVQDVRFRARVDRLSSGEYSRGRVYIADADPTFTSKAGIYGYVWSD